TEGHEGNEEESKNFVTRRGEMAELILLQTAGPNRMGATHPSLKRILTIVCCAVLTGAISIGQPVRRAESGRGKLDVSELRTVPDGNYLVTLESTGRQQWLNLKVQGNKAKCDKS